MPQQFRGSGKTVYRHSLRVWNLPDVTLASEFITGEGLIDCPWLDGDLTTDCDAAPNLCSWA